MCLVLLALATHPDYPLIVAANRDEFYDRATASAAFWSDAPDVLGGRDLQAGGTWLGVDVRGRFAAVTNYRQGRRESAAPRSRGHLVSDFLTRNLAAPAYMEQVQRDADLYNGFNLIASDQASLCYYSNREGAVRHLTAGVYGLSNHLLDTPWPKVEQTKLAFGDLLNRRGPELVDQLFALLSDRRQATDDQLPTTGVGPEWERLLSSAFIASEEYGTRSSTVVLVQRDGRIVFVERSFGRAGVFSGEVRFDVAAERRVSG
jgi:uncharacterized protein with NRDE domain